jgi:PAS domain S-box-containing protein
MTGWRLSEIAGQTPRVLQGPETDHHIFADLDTTLSRGKAWNGRTINYRKNGDPFWMEWSIVPLMDDTGKNQFYLAVQRDVTEQVETSVRLEAAQRSRRLAERARENLSRYFSPSTVELLIEKDAPFGEARRQTVAILFADIVGFTTMAESIAPEDVIEILRTFHQRIEATIFASGGSVEDIVGDEVMAVFGVPSATPSDAAKAISCAGNILVDIENWNIYGKHPGIESVKVGIGVHYGPAVMGDIGSERRMSFSVVGDTVNTANRMERLTRDFDVQLVVSDAAVSAARQSASNHELNAVLDKLEDRGEVALRGRERRLRVWALK